MYPAPAGLIEIRVAGGPAAAAVHRLSLGETTIGSGQTAAIRDATRNGFTVPNIRPSVRCD